MAACIHNTNKYLTALLLSFVLIACSEPSDEELFQQAQTYLGEGKVPEAIIKLKNVLQKNSDNYQARWLLGKTYFEQEAYAYAAKELELARQLGASKDLVLPLLAQSWLESGDFSKLLVLDTNSLTGEALAAVSAAKAHANIAKQNYSNAQKLIEQSLKINPKLSSALLARAKLTTLQPEIETDVAKHQLLDVLDVDPENATAWLTLADLEVERTEAEFAYSRALEAEPENIDARFKRGMIRIKQQKYAEAEKDAAILKKLAPKNPATYFLNGLLAYQKGNVKEAISLLELTQNEENLFPHALLYLAYSHYRQGNQNITIEYLHRYMEVVPGTVPGRKLLAAIFVKSGQSSEAEKVIKPVVDFKPEDIDAANILGEAMLRQGKIKEANKLLSKIVDLKPNSAAAKTRYAAALLVANSYDASIELLQAALQIDPNFKQGHILLVFAYTSQGDYQSALRAGNIFQTRHPQNPIPYNLIGYTYIQAGQAENGQTAFKAAWKLSPGDPTAGQALADLAIQDKQLDLAHNYYAAILQHHPDHLPVLLRLAALANLQGQAKTMVKYLQDAIEKHPKSIQPKISLSRYYLSQGKPERVPSILGEIIQDIDAPAEVLGVYGQSLLARKHFTEAARVYKNQIALQPDSAQAHYDLGLAYRGLNKNEKMKNHFKQTLALQPSYIPPRLGLVEASLLEGNTELAQHHLAYLTEAAPDNIDVLLLKAANERLKPDQKAALAYIERAYKLAPNTRTLLALSQQLRLVGELPRMQQLQENWAKVHPDDMANKMSLAGYYVERGLNDSAIPHYESALQAEPDNFVALNNLAWLKKDHDTRTALKYAERAVKLQPKSAPALDTYASVLLTDKQLDKARQAIDQALAIDDPNTFYPLSQRPHICCQRKQGSSS